jgi:tetratricopeptide (TPR) repeat protein
VKLTAEAERKIAERPIDNIQAYECYLKAKQATWSFEGKSFDQAERQLQNALDIVGPNELLYATLGILNAHYVSFAISPDESYMKKAEEYAQKLSELNPESTYAHSLKAAILFARGEMQDAIRHYKRAYQIDPDNPDTLMFLNYFYAAAGKTSAAMPLAQRAVEIDPLTAANHGMPGWVELMAGRLEAALPYYEKASRLEPHNQTLQFFYAWVLGLNNRREDAYRVIDRFVEINPQDVTAQLGTFLKFALQGRKEDALKSVTPELEAVAKEAEFYSRFMMHCYALIGENEKALDWLENDVRLGFINYPFLAQYDPFLKNLRGEDRFKKIMDRVKGLWERFEV